MSARSLRCVAVGLGALVLSCSSVREIASISDATGGLIQAAGTVVNAVDEVSECQKLSANPSVEEEYALGGAVALNWVRQGGGLINVKSEEKLVRYINIVGSNLGAQSPRPTLQWTFGVLRTVESFNAVSSPGGYVFVTLGLLQGVENEAQLAGVLAHEIAHITSKHALTRYSEVKVGQCRLAVAARAGKQLSNSSSLRLAPEAVEDLLALLKDQSGTVNLDKHVELLGGLTEASVDTLVEKGFGKEDEFAADAEAVRMLVSAGYDPREYITLLGKIPDSRGSFSNHPSKAERMKRLVAQLKTLESPGGDFPELAVNLETLARPPLPPELTSVKGTVAHDKP